MIAWSTLIAQLDAHAAAFELLDRAKQGLEDCFVNMGGAIDGWTMADVRAEFDSHKLAFRHAALPPFIETRLTLLHAQHGYPVGNYRLITDLEGTTTDDFLVFERSRTPT